MLADYQQRKIVNDLRKLNMRVLSDVEMIEKHLEPLERDVLALEYVFKPLRKTFLFEFLKWKADKMPK